MQDNLEAAQRAVANLPDAEHDGFVRAVVDPYVNALHRALLGQRRLLKPSIRAARRALVDRVLSDGPAALDTRQRRILLYDPDLITELHCRVWELSDPARAAHWGRPGQAAASPTG